MAPADNLSTTLEQIRHHLSSRQYSEIPSLLSRAKLALLHLNALVPTRQTPSAQLALARETLELGALASIQLQDPAAFTRYFAQLQPFYALPESVLDPRGGARSKVTGLYLLLLLSQGDYAGFHTELEALEVAMAARQTGGDSAMTGAQEEQQKRLEDDPFIQYPIRLEQALMEGSYDRVWGETKSERVPSEEFAIFSDVLIVTIRNEIASCSERAYQSLPIQNAKQLFFLDSEGSVVQFAHSRNWTVRDGRLYFPRPETDLLGTDKDILVTSDQVIQNTIGYARELETIV